MSFLTGNTKGSERQRLPGSKEAQEGAPNDSDGEINGAYSDLMARRPALLEEELKLHSRIIDEFNLALLEKLSPEELHRQVQNYVNNHVRAVRIAGAASTQSRICGRLRRH